MAKRFTDTNKYKKPFIRGLQGPYKLLWDYICLDCNHAGIWIKDFEIAQIYLGADMAVNENEAIKVFCDKVYVFDNGDRWFIPSFIGFQYGELNPENRAHNSVIKIIAMNNLGKALTRALQGRKDKDKDKDKDMDKEGIVKGKFKKPTLEEAINYCLERGNAVNPEKWHSYYESNGWKVGKNPMKNWRAAIITWENNDTHHTEVMPIKGKAEII